MRGYSAAHGARGTPRPETLPEPAAEELAHTRSLVRLIQDEIERAGGMIPFARYMELALYAPGLGYYSGPAPKFGPEGDFVTAPELSPLFSHCLARQCAQVLEALGGGAIMEVGAGSGVMAADVLAELERLDRRPDRYYILELSGALRARQARTLVEKVPRLSERVSWLARLPDAGFRGVVLANEVLDAMPVHRLRAEGAGVSELHVAWDGERFVWRAGALSGQRLAEVLGRLQAEVGALAPGYVTEVGLAQPAWVHSVGERLAAGVLLMIDYGFPRRELYHPQRSEGTLMCHYRHRAHGDPLILTGLQDITAHVDFTSLAEAGVVSGLTLAGYTSQAFFLLANGLTEGLGTGEPETTQGHLERASQVKRLTMPGEMGELFKVMALARGVAGPLQGFSLEDRRL